MLVIVFFSFLSISFASLKFSISGRAFPIFTLATFGNIKTFFFKYIMNIFYHTAVPH